MWKDKEYEYLSSAWNKNNKLVTLAYEMSAEKNVEKSCTVQEQAP